MERTDDLSVALFAFALIGLAILASGCGALAWWQVRFKPSPATTWAAWAGFLWLYGTSVRLAVTSAYLVPQVLANAAGWGIATVAAVWVVRRMLRPRPSSR